MTERSGPIKVLQVATAHALVDTYYDVTNTITMGRRANSLRLFFTTAVSSPGDVTFRLTVNNPNNADLGATTFYDYCTEGEAPETFGPLNFTAAGQTKMIILRGLDLLPLDVIQVSYAATLNAAGSTVAIIGESFHSDMGGGSLSVEEIEVDMAALEVLVTASNALLTTIDADTAAMVVDLDAIETLITSGNAILTTIDTDTGNIAADTAAMVVDLAAMEVLLTNLETLSTAANVDLDAIETLITAGNVDLAAMEALLITIDSDTDAIKTATEALVTAGGGDGYVASVDAAFVTGDSPVTVDVNDNLARNGNQGWITNDGAGDFTIAYSNVGTPTYGTTITLKNGETFSFDGKNIDQFRITWVADSAYRYFIR